MSAATTIPSMPIHHDQEVIEVGRCEPSHPSDWAGLVAVVKSRGRRSRVRLAVYDARQTRWRFVDMSPVTLRVLQRHIDAAISECDWTDR